VSTPAPPFASFADAFAWLASRTNYETMATQSYDARTYGLDRVHSLLDAVGRPDHELDAVQFVGSKGKGSASAMLDSILRASGRRTGLYTSPHLIDPRERIRVNGEWADDELVASALSTLRNHAEASAERGEPTTFFEIHTVAALLTFVAAECDTAVLEAGMGGRLDATSAAQVRSVALTSLSLDHMAQLGTTLESMAREKAAAARPGRLFVCGHRPGTTALPVIEEICAERGSPLLVLGRDFEVEDVLTAYARDSGAVCTSFTLLHAGHRIHPR
jgi:dihydrofolate synthase/folylpolyglutamate synthase